MIWGTIQSVGYASSFWSAPPQKKSRCLICALGCCIVLRPATSDWMTRVVPPPPVSKNHLAQEPTPGSAVKFSHHFFPQGSGFFMFLVDVGQLFRCAGHHFMCVTTGPPIRGDPISQSQAHIPLKPLPPALDPFPEATSL